MKRDLDESFRVVGSWRSAAAPDTQLAGELTYDPVRGLDLEVLGSFTTVPRFVSQDDGVDEVILGETRTERVTLLRCTYNGASYATAGSGHTDYHSDCAIFGCHIVDEPAPEFDELVFHVPLFDAWWPVTGLRSQMWTSPDTGLVQGFRNHYEAPDRLEVEVPLGTISLGSQASGGGSVRLANRTTRMQEAIHFRVNLHRPITVPDAVNDVISPVLDLVTLLTGYPSRLAKVAVVSDVEYPQDPTKTGRLPFDVVFRQAADPGIAPTSIDTHQFLLDPRSDECPDFGDLLRAWFTADVALERSKDLLFAMHRAPKGTYAENRFITLCQSAEIFHRFHPEMEQRSMPGADFAQRLQQVGTLPDESTRTWVLQKLQYGNEPTLMQRLKALRSYAVGSRTTLWPTAMLRKIVDTRNYLTHGGKQLKAKAASFPDMYYLSEYLSFLVKACLLRQLGLDDGVVEGIISSNSRFRWLEASYRR